MKSRAIFKSSQHRTGQIGRPGHVNMLKESVLTALIQTLKVLRHFLSPFENSVI